MADFSLSQGYSRPYITIAAFFVGADALGGPFWVFADNLRATNSRPYRAMADFSLS
ncbi:MAG: hypothetical protein FWF44_11145 [Defluviitaleaceae bacterium]|nr:hypothetical protein [Defluviitaleaceae bacterium]